VSAGVPDLPPGCGSWVVVRRATGEAVLETFSRQLAERVNLDAYQVLTALDWLERLNQPARRTA
jgi:hypothetical protein